MQRRLDTFQWRKRRREGIVRNLKTSKIFPSKSLRLGLHSIFVATTHKTVCLRDTKRRRHPSLLHQPNHLCVHTELTLGWINYTISLLVPVPTIISPLPSPLLFQCFLLLEHCVSLSGEIHEANRNDKRRVRAEIHRNRISFERTICFFSFFLMILVRINSFLHTTIGWMIIILM